MGNRTNQKNYRTRLMHEKCMARVKRGVVAHARHKKVLKLLFDNGADMQFNPYASERMEAPPAWNPLTCALIGQKIEIAKILLRMGVRMTQMKGQVPTLMHILLWQIPRVLVDKSLSYL